MSDCLSYCTYTFSDTLPELAIITRFASTEIVAGKFTEKCDGSATGALRQPGRSTPPQVPHFWSLPAAHSDRHSQGYSSVLLHKCGHIAHIRRHIAGLLIFRARAAAVHLCEEMVQVRIRLELHIGPVAEGLLPKAGSLVRRSPGSPSRLARSASASRAAAAAGGL